MPFNEPTARVGRRASRRQFLCSLALAGLSAAGLTLLNGCGTPSSPGSKPAPGAAAPAATPADETPDSASMPPGTRLSLATGGTGGVFYPLGTGLATLLQKYLGAQATAEVTAASVANMKLLNERRKETIAFTQADVAYDALQGSEVMRDLGPIQVRSLGILYLNYMHLVASESSGINTPADLKGKRVSVGATASGTELKADRVLEAFDIDPATDIQRQHLGVAESASALKEGTLDAFFFDGGLPTGAIADLANTPGLKIKLIPHGEAVARMNSKYGDFYSQITIPKETYQGMTADVPVVAGLPNILAVHEEFPEQTAYAVLATIFDHKAEWDAIHPVGKNTRLETAWQVTSVPLHSGALRFYRDRGVYRGR